MEMGSAYMRAFQARLIKSHCLGNSTTTSDGYFLSAFGVSGSSATFALYFSFIKEKAGQQGGSNVQDSQYTLNWAPFPKQRGVKPGVENRRTEIIS